MRRQAELPEVFSQYRVQYVQKVSAVEWSSECPTCGGVVHSDGEWPDRCRWFMKGKSLGWCRVCSTVHWPDAKTPMSTGEFAEWRKEQQEREEARKRSAEKALAHLQDTAIWRQYHDRMGLIGSTYWKARGLSGAWQAFWQLGYKADHILWIDAQEYSTPSATIPIWQEGWQVANVKHRLITPPATRGKYVYEISGQTAPMFVCNPDSNLTGQVVAVEGEIKAMVTFATLDDAKICVVGLPGTNPPEGVIAKLKQASGVTLVFDPGSNEQAAKLAVAIGKRTKVLVPSRKIDDGILEAGLTGHDVRALLAQARMV
jgi:hypothetical protein